MKYQDVVNALNEKFPVEVIDGFDINQVPRTNIMSIIQGIKKDKLDFINESLIEEYAYDKALSFAWAYRTMCFLYEIEAIESMNSKYAAVLFTK